MRTAARLVTVLVSAPLALGLLAGTASADGAGSGAAGSTVAGLAVAAPLIAAPPAAAPVVPRDPMGPPTGMDPSMAPMGPSMPDVTAPSAAAPSAAAPEAAAPSAAGPATALPRTGDETTVLLSIAGVLLVLAGVLMHIAARPIPSVNPRFVVQLA